MTIRDSNSDAEGYGALLKSHKSHSSYQTYNLEEGKVVRSTTNDVHSHRFPYSSSPSPPRAPSPIAKACQKGVTVFFVLLVLFLFALTAWNAQDVSPMAYDYIVVGGGPAGIIAATKLAKFFPNLQVLLLESGTVSQSSVLQSKERFCPSLWQDDRSFSLNKFDVPLLWTGVASSQGRREMLHMEESWSDHHWPIKKTLLGRGLGGCGLHNAMIYVRSLPTDYERWNVTGWTYDEILKHHVNMERFVTSPASEVPFWNDEPNQANQPWRGRTGPVTTIPAGVGVDALAPLFVQSALSSGHRLATRGFNDPDPSARIGAGYYEFNIRDGVRDSVANAFLGHGRKPENLVVRTGITVTRFLTSQTKESARAVGVEYMLDGSGRGGKYLLSDLQKAQVILAAGAIMTPQLLFNSGISQGGDVADVPGVGKNLQDHPVVAMAFEISAEIAQQASSIYTVGDEMEDYFLSVAKLKTMDTSFSNDTIRQNISKRLGPFATAGFSAGAFLKSPWAAENEPDIQLTVFPRQLEPHVTRRQKEEDDAYMRSHAMLVTVALLRPEARYEVRPSVSARKGNHVTSEAFKKDVRSDVSSFTKGWESSIDESNPLAKKLEYRLPSIQLPAGKDHYLSDSDVNRLVWGMEQVRKIQSNQPLSNVTRKEIYPGSRLEGDDLGEYVRVHSLPNSHWTGSTKMGAADDPMAVVDERLRVRGVEGLRIVDAGVIPHVPNGNIHSTVCAVSSRAADLMAEDRNE